MATLPAEEVLAPDDVQRGSPKNEVGGGGDTSDVCNVDGVGSSITEGNVHDTGAASYRSATSGGGLPREAGGSGDTSRSHGDTEGMAPKTASLEYNSSPSLSTGSVSALGAAGTSDSVENRDEHGDTGDDAAGVAAEVAIGAAGSDAVGACSTDAANADLGRSIDDVNAANKGSGSSEAERGAARSCTSGDGGTAEAGVGIITKRLAENVAEGDGTGGGCTENTATGSVGSGTEGGGTTATAATGSIGVGSVAGAAGPSRVPSGRGRIASAAYAEPAVVPPTVHYGIYVNNIPLDVEDDELRALFEPYGEVLRLKLVRRPEFTTFLFAYVLLDSDDNTKRAIHALDGTTLKGQKLKVEPTFGRATHIFNIGEGTPYNRSRAELEQWRQNRDAQQASGNQKRQQRNDDQWRRGYNDRNYHQGDRRFGDCHNGYRYHGDRFQNNDRRYGGRGGDDRYGAHNYRNNQGRYNNRYNNRNWPRQQHSGYHGDGGGHSHYGHGSSEGRNQRGGFGPSDDGQRRHRGHADNRYGGDFGRRGGGGHDGGNRIGEDEGHANYERTQEARGRMRDAWTRRLECMAAEGNDEGLPSFDELLQLVRHTPYNLPRRTDLDIDYEEEDDGAQPIFWWSRDRFATGAGGDDFGQEHAPCTVRELLRWRHGEDAVAEVAGKSETKEEGGVCLTEDGGADGEQRPRRSSRERVLSAVTNDRDGGARDDMEDVVNGGASGGGDAALTDKQNKYCLKQGQPSSEQCTVEQISSRDSESTVAESNFEKSVTHKDDNSEPLEAPASRGRNCSTNEDDDTSENTSLGHPSTGISSLDAFDLSVWESSEGQSEDDALHIERAPRCSISITSLIENLDNPAGSQVPGEPQPRSSKVEGELKDTVFVEKQSKGGKQVLRTDCTSDRAGKSTASSVKTESATAPEDDRGKVTSGAYSAGAAATDGSIQQAGPYAAAPQNVKPGLSERNLSVAKQLKCSSGAETNETDREEPNDAQPQRKVALAITQATIAERMQAESTWNRDGGVASVRGVDDDSGDDGTDDYEDVTDEDESDYLYGASFCAEIIVRMKNAKNAVHLAASRDTDAPGSAPVAEVRDVPRERRVGNVTVQDLTEDENVPPRPPAPVPPYEPFVFGRLSSSSGVREYLAQSDLLHRDSGGLTSSNKLAAIAHDSNDRVRIVVLDDEKEAACVAAKGLGESGAKPEETRRFQRAKRRLRQTVAGSVVRRPSPGGARLNALVDGVTSESGAATREKEVLKRNKVDKGIQTASASGEDNARRALSLPRKRVLEENSDTNDEPSDSEFDDSLRRETSRAKHRDCKAADSIDRPAEAAEGSEDEWACGETPKKGRRPTEEHLVEGDGVSGTSSSATVQDSRGDVSVSTGSDERPANDGVALHYDQEGEDSRRDCAEEDPQTADEQGTAQSSCAGGGGDGSSETGRRDDAVDTRRPPRALRRDEEIECEPSDDVDGQ
ncbi:hypothetical protein HPB50_017015 [Hyalomma asiaticum]|uniref:Uncharacterized protein n=1 Tax=Hyalomma asiaticum TaxID=266040 RepID=A0ACB7RL54_HYAAI|nr:hypothetical protein HPB50_017015 [Hyalomma asiaticum]